MDEQPESTATVGKHSFNWQAFILWPIVIVLLYVLSFGPVFRMEIKGTIRLNNQFCNNFYEPIAWAYWNTQLHKPLGMYFHSWVPEVFDKNGDNRPTK